MQTSSLARNVIGIVGIMAALVLIAWAIPLVQAARSAPSSSTNPLITISTVKGPPITNGPTGSDQIPTGWNIPKPDAMPGAQPNNGPGKYCNNPCTPPLKWYGGQVKHKPHVFLIYWGTKWSNTKAPNYTAYLQIETRMKTLFSHLAGSTYNAMLAQYHDSEGFIVNSTKDPVLEASVGLPQDPPADITNVAEAAAIQKVLASNTVWNTVGDAIFILMPQDGSTYNDLILEKGCAYHYITADNSDRVYAILPYLANAQFGAGCLSYGGGDLINAMTVTASHEYAEAVTDPYVNHLSTEAWRDTDRANEITDLCADDHTNVSALGAVVAYQFDNKAWDANHTQGCDYALYEPPPIPKAMFNGDDAQGIRGLWITDGSQSGTFEVKNIVGANSGGLAPQNLTSIGSKIVFSGKDAKGNYQAWVTNGTSAGTFELTTQTNGYYGGVSPYNFTRFGTKAVFGGYDTNANPEVWVTDGTRSGTMQLTTSGNVSPSDAVVFAGKLFFENGLVHPTGYGLWTTDGTPAGTAPRINSPITMSCFAVFGSRAYFTQPATPLSQLGVWTTDGTDAGTHAVQDPTKPGYAVEPCAYTAAGGKVVFSAFDSTNHVQLWATDGTAGGTQEMNPITNLSGGLYPSGLTVLGSQVIFSGIDAQNSYSVWSTNGTSIKEVSKQSSAPSGFTRLGSEMLFAADDPTYGNSLWITNGSTGSTRLGTFTGLNPTAITQFGNRAVFNGVYVGSFGATYQELWVTYGTSSGTKPLTTQGSILGPGGVDPTNFAVLT